MLPLCLPKVAVPAIFLYTYEGTYFAHRSRPSIYYYEHSFKTAFLLKNKLSNNLKIHRHEKIKSHFKIKLLILIFYLNLITLLPLI